MHHCTLTNICFPTCRTVERDVRLVQWFRPCIISQDPHHINEDSACIHRTLYVLIFFLDAGFFVFPDFSIRNRKQLSAEIQSLRSSVVSPRVPQQQQQPPSTRLHTATVAPLPPTPQRIPPPKLDQDIPLPSSAASIALHMAQSSLLPGPSVFDGRGGGLMPFDVQSQTPATFSSCSATWTLISRSQSSPPHRPQQPQYAPQQLRSRFSLLLHRYNWWT